MTSPVNPSVDPLAPPTPSLAGQGDMDDEIRMLAAALAPAPVTSLSAVKGIVTAVSLGDASTPPTITATIGGIDVADICIAANCHVYVGATVVLVRQGTQYVALYRVAAVGSKSDVTEGGWISPVLAANVTNSGSVVKYRRVLNNGCWEMQWRGEVNTTITGDGDLVATKLAAEYRPAFYRKVPVTTSLTGGDVSARVDFADDGGVSVVGLTEHGATAPPWISLEGVRYFL